jgi:hypothetical protein
LELGRLAAQLFDATFWLTVGISLAISGAAFLVMRLYTRAVMRESQRGGSRIQPEASFERVPLPDAGPLEIEVETLENDVSGAPRSVTFKQAKQAFRRAAWCYVVAGVVHAASSTALLFYSGSYTPLRASSALTLWTFYGAVFWAWLFTTVVALALFYGPDRWLRLRLVTGYIGVLPLMGAVLLLAGAPRLPLSDIPMLPPEAAAMVLSSAQLLTGKAATADTFTFPPDTQPPLFFALSTIPWMIPILGFNRLIRGTVGPVFITFALLLVLTPPVVLDLLIARVPASLIRQFVGDSPVRALWTVSFIVAAALACIVLMWVVRRYRHRKMSDQSFLFDALWLSVSVWVCVYLMRNAPGIIYLAGLLPFVLYKLVVWYGLRRFVVSARPLPNARLLFLRVFGSAARSEKLFDLVAARWRYAGSVQLISGTDIARSRFEPDEFLDFIAGRFKTRYIDNSADVAQRLAQIESRPDPDGRYRVHEFFCRADAWQETVTKLMEHSDLVAMDLRGFTSERRGCIFELGALMDHLPLERVVLLTDHTTDVPLLRQALQSLWTGMDPSSPNRQAAAGRVRIIDLTRGYPRAVRRLMQIGDEVLVNYSAPGGSAQTCS